MYVKWEPMVNVAYVYFIAVQIYIYMVLYFLGV